MAANPTSRRALRWTLRSAAAVVCCSALVACSVPDQKHPVAIENARLPSENTTTSTSLVIPVAQTTVYFVGANNQLAGVSKTVSGLGVGTAVKLLLGGPTSAETVAGMSSAIPQGTQLNSSDQSGSLVELDFSNSLASVSGREQLLAIAQIVATAASVRGVTLVALSVEGQPVNAPLPDGTLAQGPVAMADYASLIGH